MNEELQSANDELQMINDVLRLRGEELDTTKAFAALTLRSLGSAVVVVDADLRVHAWGPGAEDFWGLLQRSRRARVRRTGHRPAGPGGHAAAGADARRRASHDRSHRGRSGKPAWTPRQDGAGVSPAARWRRQPPRRDRSDERGRRAEVRISARRQALGPSCSWLRVRILYSVLTEQPVVWLPGWRCTFSRPQARRPRMKGAEVIPWRCSGLRRRLGRTDLSWCCPARQTRRRPLCCERC
jgi:hypothetical protein